MAIWRGLKTDPLIEPKSQIDRSLKDTAIHSNRGKPPHDEIQLLLPMQVVQWVWLALWCISLPDVYAVTTCTVANIVVASGRSKKVVNLDKARCMFMDNTVNDAWNGAGPADCSVTNMLFTAKTGCIAHYRNKMVKFKREVWQSNGKYVTHPYILLQRCRLAGVFKKEYVKDGTCAATNGEEIRAEQTKYMATTDGVHVCRSLRAMVIARCATTRDPTSNHQRTTRTHDLCALKFNGMLRTGTYTRLTARTAVKTIPVFNDAEASKLMPELVFPFALNHKSTYNPIPIQTTTIIDSSTNVCFSRSDDDETHVANIKKLYARGRHGVFSEEQRELVVKTVATFVPVNKRNKHVGVFLFEACKGDSACVQEFLQSKWFTTPFPTLDFAKIKKKVQALFKRHSVSIRALIPSISVENWFQLYQTSIILDEDLIRWFGRHFMLYSDSTVQNELKALKDGLDVVEIPFKSKKKSTVHWGAMMPLHIMTSFIFSEEVPFKELVKPYSQWLLKVHRLVFEVTTNNPDVPVTKVSGWDFYTDEQRKEACEQTSIETMCVICPGTERRDISRCKRDGMYHQIQYDVNGVFVGNNVQLTKTVGKEQKLVVYVDVSFTVWYYVMYLINQAVSEEQSNGLTIDAISLEDRAIAASLMPHRPKPQFSMPIHCNLDGADMNRKADSLKGFDSVTKFDCVLHWKRPSGLIKNKNLVLWYGIFPGKDSYEVINGNFHAGNGYRMIREDMTKVIVDLESHYWCQTISFFTDSMANEGLCGGYSCRKEHDVRFF